MNVFQIIENLYTNRRGEWIFSLDDTLIQPFVIQRFLAMNDSVRVQTRWLDKYVFSIPPKMYLSLAWSVLPKFNRPPFVKYIKQNNDEEEYQFILERVRKHYKLSDNDYKANRERLITAIKNNTIEWFKYYGIEKRFWKKYYLNFNEIKVNDKPEKEVSTSLSAWGL